MFVENHKNSYNTPYKFNGKEQDSETGYYYYGARYYNPRVSLWLGVDPLADYNPFYNSEHYIDGQHNGGVYNSGNLNPYIYTYQNPIVYIDPNGKQTKVTVNMTNITIGYEELHNRYFYITTGTTEVNRTKGINWIGSQEYTYTIFPHNENTPITISSQDLKKGKQDELPGLMDKLFNPYNLVAYRETKKIISKFKGDFSSSDVAGRTSSLLKLINKGVGKAELLSKYGLILQAIGTSLDITNEISIGEFRNVKRILAEDTFDYIFGEYITKEKGGQLYDVLGKPLYEEVKEKSKEINNVNTH